MNVRFLSERPGSNWRHSAWKADALPTELLSPVKQYKDTFIFNESKAICVKISKNFCPFA